MIGAWTMDVNRMEYGDGIWQTRNGHGRLKTGYGRYEMADIAH